MRRALVTLLGAPLLGPPLFLGALVTADTLAGEGLFLYQLRYEQRLLATEAVRDFAAALAGAYLAAALLCALGSVARRRSGSRATRWWMCVAGLTLGAGLGLLVARRPQDPGVWALALAGVLYAVVLSAPLIHLLTLRDAGRSGA